MVILASGLISILLPSILGAFAENNYNPFPQLFRSIEHCPAGFAAFRADIASIDRKSVSYCIADLALKPSEGGAFKGGQKIYI